jgi:5-methylcytosine-specific restriction endonuclease McrA
VEWERVLKEIEDHLFPRLHLTVRQRALYYHLFSHTRLVGSESSVFALLPLANVLDISESTAREDLRDLHSKGCIRIEERSRVGHLVRVLLPEEIDGIVVEAGPAETVDMESLDFFTDRRFVDVLLVRESGRCFYCLRSVRKETCQLDHVTPQLAAGGNSYRNIVAACHECNTQKQGFEGDDFVRTLYRRGVLSQVELEGRLRAIEKLKAGNLAPVI